MWQMYQPVDTGDTRAVAQEVQSAYLELFPDGDLTFVSRVFGWAQDCFLGQYAGYQAIDAPYHDLEHTMQGALCMIRLLRQRQWAGAMPQLDRSTFELGLLAILLHDTGYLKQHDDHEGTGAKYTMIHVDRSAEFAAQLLNEKGYPAAAVRAVQNMIHCTGVNLNLLTIPFASEADRVAGYALGTGDLLGQMAADDYIEKLPELYSEFEEAARFTPGKVSKVGLFSSAEDLLRKTPKFWQYFVRPKLEQDFAGLYKYLNFPYPDGPNYYLERIEANIARLSLQLQAMPP